MNEPFPKIQRRSLMALGGFAGISGLLTTMATTAATESTSGKESPAETENARIVTEFCKGWSTRDLSKVLMFLADDCVYRMTETTPAVTGHKAISERLQPAVEKSDQVEFRVLETFARGPLVLNHRVDRFMSKTRPLSWEGVGVFFLQNGKIKEWSDYTIRVS